MFNSDTLGIKRGEVRVFYKHPQRSNIFQQVRSVEDFSTRFDRSDLCTLVLSGTCGMSIFWESLLFLDLGSAMKHLGFSFPSLLQGRRFRCTQLCLISIV